MSKDIDLSRYKKYFTIRYFLIISICVLSFFVFTKLRRLFFILILVSLNCGFGYLKRLLFINLKLDSIITKSINLRHIANAVELITFTTVLSSYAFDYLAGMVVGGLSIIGTYIFERRVSRYSLATVPLYILLGYLAFLLKPCLIDIRALGIILSLVYNIIINSILFTFFRAKLVKMGSFSVVNILLNVYLFTNIAPLLIKII
ncbi:hypothetical protein JW930_05950 [Candidatus Woesearchaeota archaeon]|nr:hypothetical protein [Candidatus Woesearchaeota archaeon]